MSEGKSKYPRHYAKIMQKYPKFADTLEKLGTTARKEGPIDLKTGHLIQLAAAASIHSEGAVHSHTKRALDAGASPEEIRHAVILLTSTIGFPTVAAALCWIDDVLN